MQLGALISANEFLVVLQVSLFERRSYSGNNSYIVELSNPVPTVYPYHDLQGA